MSIDLTFKSVCLAIKRQGKDDPKLIEAVDYLLGIALICSPVVLGPAAAALLPTLAVKNELIKIGKGLFDKLTKKKDEDYLLRHDTMSTAYGLLVFTSFFDALDATLPEALRRELKVLDKEKPFLSKEITGKALSKKHEVPVCEAHDSPIASYTIMFPHPTETLAEQGERQSKLWKQMAQCFVELVQRLAFWENADEKKKANLLAGLDKLDEEAKKRFEAQYFELARKFEDFAIWANLQAHKGTKALIGEMSEYVKLHAKLSAASAKVIDVGFTKLRETVLSIPETLRISQATDIAIGLNKHYQARVNDPIIEDKETVEEGKPRLSFPKISDAFVPQAFRVLRQSGSSRRLEDESTWGGLPRRNDLGAFLLSYLSSPYGTEAPLLILGHPGSGKSLLTTILSAQLMSEQFTAIRVPLREVNADADIVTQIEDAIRRITGVSFDSWTRLSALFKNCPPVVILDGYDELLQASGQVFASYVKDAKRFQEREAEQGRPLRVIVTSRVTLIDKASVPVGATIIKLLEFDAYQRECWSRIWNKANVGYFRDAGIEPFSLPMEGEKGAEKILNLAEQPLLLLMLALYDSQDNQLRNSRGLDRTKLYDSLLRRFVMRERGKEKGFIDSKAKEREKALSTEMQRLGVAALGMYNRRKVHILSPELDDDLSFFKLEREITAKPGIALSQADLLLGSFFFVHKSKAQHASGAEDTHEETAAFEFLHNTFGEFLTADFILRRAVAQVLALRAAESNEALRSMLDKMMGTADGFERDWFASLVYTPLFTRPVVMEMIREWAPHILRDNGISEDDFVETLEKIVLNQIKRMLNKREMPQIMRRETAQEGYRAPFGDHPLVGHIAIYSINLILLRLVAGKRPLLFDESEVAVFENGTRPWDRLMHIWRSWFALGNLNALAAVMIAERAGSNVTVTAKSKFQAVESRSKLHELHNVLLSLGDGVSAGVIGLYLFDPTTSSEGELNLTEERLSSEGFHPGAPLSIARLLSLARNFPDSPEEFVPRAKRALEQALENGRRDQLEHICLIIVRIFEENLLSRSWMGVRDRVFREVFHPGFAVDIAKRAPRAARIVVDLGKQLRDIAWLEEFSGRFIEDVAEVVSRGMFESDHSTWASWIRLLRDVGGVHNNFSFMHRRRFSGEFVNRLFDPRRLIEISERNPEEAFSYLQILLEWGGRLNFERFIQQEMEPGILDRVFKPRNLAQLIERNPEAALACLRTLRELSGGRHFERHLEQELEPEFFDRLFHPGHLLDMSERSPEAALAYLQIARDLGHAPDFERKMNQEFFGHVLDPRFLLELSERNPEAAMTYLQILHEVGAGRYFEQVVEREMDTEFFERILHPRYLLDFGGRRQSGLSVWLACARLFNSRRFNQLLTKAISEELGRRPGIARFLSTLSIASLIDLRWLSQQTDSPDLRTFVAELTA